MIISLFRYRRYYESILKYFPLIIAYTLLSEILGYFIRDYEIFQIIYLDKYYYSNYVIFNIYDIIFFFYFYFVYWKLIHSIKHQSIIKYGAITYLLASIINPFFQNVLTIPQVYASTVGSIVLIISILLYFKENKHEVHKKKSLMVWVSFGLLIFNVFFPIIMLSGLFSYDFYQKLNFQQFHYFLIVAMYLCFIIGFIKMKHMKALPKSR